VPRSLVASDAFADGSAPRSLSAYNASWVNSRPAACELNTYTGGVIRDANGYGGDPWYYYNDAFDGDQYAEIGVDALPTGTARYGVALRCSTDTSGNTRDAYLAYYRVLSGTTYELKAYRVDNGSFSAALIDTTFTLDAGSDRFSAEIIGGTISVYKNYSGSGDTPLATYTDGAPLTGGRPGVYTNASPVSNAYITSWEGGNASAGSAAASPEPKRLGRWRRMPTRMVSGVWRYVRTLADAAANLAANVFSVDVSESGSASDTLSAQLSAAVSLAEAANAADTISNVLTSARSFTEAGGATDNLTTTATFPRSIGTEAGSAGDSLSSSVGGFDVTIAETATAVDSISALLNAAVTLAETGSATDSYSNLATLLAALAESVTATDTYSSALNGGNYSVSFTEAATAVDAIAAQVAWSRDVAETGNATDTTSAQAAFQRAVAEAVAALDALAATGVTNVSISEAGNASDLMSAPTGFGEVPPERVITIQLADRVVRITKTRRPIRVLN
jgi:hypothetical protein